MKIVVSMGGSLLTKELTANNFKKYADVLVRLAESGHSLIVVCGGGRVCRQYRDVAKEFTNDHEKLDFIGIMATHLNASTLAAAIEGSHLVAWKTLEEAKKDVVKNFGRGIVIGGGYDVGTSSDYDAAAFAEAVGADLLINASNIDGVYTADPKKVKDAKKLEKLTHEEFEDIIMQNPQVPGEYRLFDLPAVRLIKELRLKTVFIDGNDPEEIARAVDGSHSGSVIG